MVQFEDFVYEVMVRCGVSQLMPEPPNLSIQEHFRSFWNSPGVGDATLDPLNYGRKSESQSTEFRNQGNDACKRGDCGSALALYTKAMLHAPHSESELEPLALAFGNRSAVLFRIEKYPECVNDIKLALKYGFPSDKRLKLHKRSAACYEFLGDYSKAAKSYGAAIDLCGSNGDMLEELMQKKMAAMSLKSKKDLKVQDCNPWQPVPAVPGSCSTGIGGLSNAAQLSSSETRGRHYIAKRSIEPGEVILIEQPYSFSCDSDKSLTNCSSCLKRCPIPMPCRSCSLIVYCGEKCENKAWKSFHRFECQIMPFLHNLSHHISPNSLYMQHDAKKSPPVVLRMIFRTGLKRICRKFAEDKGHIEAQHKMATPRRESDSFQSLNDLLWTDEQRDSGIAHALIVLKLLKTTSFFEQLSAEVGAESANNATKNETNIGVNGRTELSGETKEKSGAAGESSKNETRNGLKGKTELSGEAKETSGAAGDTAETSTGSENTKLTAQQSAEFDVYMGALLYVLHRISRLNTMSIVEYEFREREKAVHSSDSSPSQIPQGRKHVIGSGVFLQTCMFNHSCYANVTYNFHGTGIVFRAMRSIGKGEEILSGYIPGYINAPLADRQMALRSCFDFVCSCPACVEEWPMQSSAVRVYCQRCRTPMPQEAERCPGCNEKQSDGELSSSVSATEEAFVKARDQLNRTGEFTDSFLRASVAWLKHLERTYAPPCRFIQNVLNFVDVCFIVRGNCYDLRGVHHGGSTRDAHFSAENALKST